MTVKVNGFTDLGEFLTGNIDFFTITTLVPCEQTSVSKPLTEIKKDLNLTTENISTKGGVVIFDVLYGNDDDYSDAFAKQNNLNMFIKLVETRAQAVMLNAYSEGVVGNVSNYVPAGSHEPDFGSTYAGGGGTIYTIKFATEHEDAWLQDSLATELNGRPIIDISTPVITDPNRFDTESSSLRNTVILKNQFL